jgi:hypothetical protein
MDTLLYIANRSQQESISPQSLSAHYCIRATAFRVCPARPPARTGALHPLDVISPRTSAHSGRPLYAESEARCSAPTQQLQACEMRIKLESTIDFRVLCESLRPISDDRRAPVAGMCIADHPEDSRASNRTLRMLSRGIRFRGSPISEAAYTCDKECVCVQLSWLQVAAVAASERPIVIAIA